MLTCNLCVGVGYTASAARNWFKSGLSGTLAAASSATDVGGSCRGAVAAPAAGVGVGGSRFTANSQAQQRAGDNARVDAANDVARGRRHCVRHRRHQPRRHRRR